MISKELISDYVLVTANGPEKFSAAVRDLLSQGYDLVGSPYAFPEEDGDSPYHCQAMAKRKEPT